MARSNSTRLYTKRGRWYVDFRDYADVGGGLEALKPAGERHATRDRKVAIQRAKARLEELKAARKRGHTNSTRDLTLIGDFVEYHVTKEKDETSSSARQLAQTYQQLKYAVMHFKPHTKLRDIDGEAMRGYLTHLLNSDKSLNTALKYLYALSKAYRRARFKKVIPYEHNPFSDMINKPKKKQSEREWLEMPDAVLLLEAARLFRPRRNDLGINYAYPLIATALLTGGRPSAEVCKIRISDLDFERETIRIRGKKTQRSLRRVPMWPQLKAILEAYLMGPEAPTGEFLFPSPKDPQQPLASMNKLVRQLVSRCDLRRNITPNTFRHTYCATRLQTTDRGMPVAEITVSSELGHGTTKMVHEVYGHLGTVRHRAEVVEYPLEKYAPYLKGRLEKLAARSQELNKHGPNMTRRVPATVEAAVVRVGLDRPDLGPRKVAALLRSRGIQISPSGVRWIWIRHDMELAEKRREARRSGRLAEVLKASRLKAA